MLTRPGPVVIGPLVGLPASIVGRVLHRHGVPRPADCDPLTGQVVGATRRSANRCEHPRLAPTDRVHDAAGRYG